MLPYGEFEVYSSEEQRELSKKGPSKEEIKKAYQGLIRSLEAKAWIAIDGPGRFGSEFPEVNTTEYNPEWEKMHPEAFDRALAMAHFKDEELAGRWNAVKAEYRRYMSSVYDDSVSYEAFCEMDFPIISEIYPDFHLSKIRPKATGSFFLPQADVDEVYGAIKELGLFGETEDV